VNWITFDLSSEAEESARHLPTAARRLAHIERKACGLVAAGELLDGFLY